MIINKKLEELRGRVEYEIKFKSDIFREDSDDDGLMEYKPFKNLPELLKCLSEETINKFKADYGEDVEQIIITSISFDAKNEDGETAMHLFVSDNVRGWTTSKINNEDINNRLLTNIEKVKRIIDNTLEEYPVKY